jgi:sulfur-carrier protein
METLKVNFYSWAAKAVRDESKGGGVTEGDMTLDLPVPPQGTLRGLLEGIAERYPLFARGVYDRDSSRLNPRVTLFLNGRSIISGQALQTQLKAGDLLAVVPVAEGG